MKLSELKWAYDADWATYEGKNNCACTQDDNQNEGGDNEGGGENEGGGDNDGENTNPTDDSAIESTDICEISIWSSNGKFCVQTEKTIQIEVFNLTGSRILSFRCDDYTEQYLQNGCYIVRTPNEMKKIIVQ